MKWTSVNQALPDEDRRYLVFTDHLDIRFSDYNVINERWNIWDYGDYDDIADMEVTHWMKLPETP